MSTGIYIYLYFCLGLVMGFRVSNYEDLQIAYSLTQINACIFNVRPLQTYQGMSLLDCVKMCGLNENCEALQYRKRFHICQFFISVHQQDLTGGACIFINGSDMSVECKQTNCDTLRIPRTTPYSPTTTITMSHPVTTDSLHQPTTENCGAPPTVVNGQVVLDIKDSTFYLDTASVICNKWYLSPTTTITCTDLGTWQIPSDCIDCYPLTSWEYTGRTSVTITGRTCQKWDSQSPHSHSYTDIQYFSETKLSDAKNYCRNPFPDHFDPWCLTSDPLVEWEYCDVKKCPWT